MLDLVAEDSPGAEVVAVAESAGNTKDLEPLENRRDFPAAG